MDKKEHNIIHGIAAAPGISITEAFVYQREIETVSDTIIDDIEAAKLQLHEAIEKSRKELNKIFGLAVDKMGEKRAGIFEAQIMILDDPILIQQIFKRIESEKKVPEFIVNDEISKYQELMSSSNEPYMKERAQDLEDIKHRIIRNLKKKKWISKVVEDVIVVAHNLSPSDTVLFSRVNVRGYITNFGGLTSHAAIVARSLNIPAVVGVHDATTMIQSGDQLIIDGFNGKIVIKPTEEQLLFYRDKIKKWDEFNDELKKLKDQPAVTKDGRNIMLMANIDLPEELEMIMQYGAKGIGLVRTEQMFDVFDGFPDEEEQYESYKMLSERVYPEKLIIRTFDIGGDKFLPVDVKQPNPMLGWRGIRFLLDNTDLLKIQMRAILRASVHKNVLLLVPMITSIREVRKTKLLFEECKKELQKEGKKFNKHIPFGIMIEVPSAALMASDFAAEVDFFSIGTNDLIQYTLAVDRGNEIVASLYQEFHPAIIRSIDNIIRGAKEKNKKVSLCGEMGSNTLAVLLLVGLGLDSLSVSGAAVPVIKKIIRSVNCAELKNLAGECLKMPTEIEIHNRLEEFYNKNLLSEVQNIFKN